MAGSEDGGAVSRTARSLHKWEEAKRGTVPRSLEGTRACRHLRLTQELCVRFPTCGLRQSCCPRPLRWWQRVNSNHQKPPPPILSFWKELDSKPGVDRHDGASTSPAGRAVHSRGTRTLLEHSLPHWGQHPTVPARGRAGATDPGSTGPSAPLWSPPETASSARHCQEL